jgi:hypothetical protein
VPNPPRANALQFLIVHRVHLVVAVALAAFTAVSCSLLVDTGGLTGGSSMDAAQSDAPNDASVASGDVDVKDASTPGDAALDGGGSADSGIDASGRVTSGLLALYTLQETSGATLHDTSGVTPALDLSIQAGDAGTGSFVADGYSFAGGLARSAGPATKIFTACKASKEITLEAWMTTANLTQDPTRIAGISDGYANHDFGIDQESDRWDSLMRAMNGSNIDLLSPAGSVTKTRAHVVVTLAKIGTRTLYLNGIAAAIDSPASDVTAWDTSFPMTMGNSLSLDASFLGTVHLVAVYGRALTGEEVARNYAAGAR